MKSFEIGYGDEKIIIHPKMGSIAQTDEIDRQLLDVSDSDESKHDVEFEIFKQALDTFSAKPAEKIIREKGVPKRVPIEGGIAAHFTTRTAESERIVREAYSIVVAQMRPSSSFL